MLARYEEHALEADVRRAICDFLVDTALVDRDDLRLEENRIDVQSENLVIEVKRRIGSTGTIKPDAHNVDQLDGYLREAREAGKPERLGILTDGRHWVLRLPGIEEVQTVPPYAFTFTNATSWDRLRGWLYNESQAIEQSNRRPVEGDIRSAFSAGPRFESSIEQLAELHSKHRDNPTVAVKRELWRRLLTAALGVVVDEEPDLDRLFVRHTYLSIVVGMAVQSAFGIDIRQRVETDPLRLLDGSTFFNEVGIRGVIESDFFAWPAETGGETWLAGLAARVSRFAWRDAEYDFVRILYQSVVPPEDRRRLGEYYTPDWLAEAVVQEVVTDPLHQREFYGIWVGGQFATHQDVAGLFFARCADLYLKPEGVAGMVLPHSALQAGQYRLWRTGRWGLTEVDLGERRAWDLERIEPNDFFPVPASVAFARKVGRDGARPLAATATRWRGPAGGPFDFEQIPVIAVGKQPSPYLDLARQGASLVPRLLFFVEVEPSDTAIVPGIVRTTPRRSGDEKPPWKNLDPPSLRNVSIEEEHVWPVHLGKTVAPFVLLEPFLTVLPVRAMTEFLEPLRSKSVDAIDGLNASSLGGRMRERWGVMSSIWDENKARNTKLDLLEQMDYMGKLSTQMSRQPGIRIVYTAAGRPTAAMLEDSLPIVDAKLYWLRVDSRHEAHYLTAVINSDVLRDAVEPLMPKGQFGARDVHRHLWQLPVPKYEATTSLHRELAEAGAEAAREAASRIADLSDETEQANNVTMERARRVLRDWLPSSPVGQRIEALVAELLAPAS